MSSFIYEPINTLKQLGEDIWICDGDVVHMDMKVCKVPFPTRMVVLKLSNGELFVHSPINLTDSLAAQIKSLGNVKYIVAPNKIHYTYIKQWADYFKGISVYAVEGIKERAKDQNIPVKIDEVLTHDSFSELSEDLDYCLFKGSSFMDEAVFNHKKSKTLIVVDLIENFEKEKIGLFKYLIFKIVGITAPNGKAPKDLRLTFKNGGTSARKSLSVIKEWSFDKIVMAHGKIVKENARYFFKRSFSWVDKI
ncbi:MAG TPA: DUF4336 domain-containing protein [Alphaproteobacteria bacterium]|nr:DUF4336 domain-containing protein [Alphaproteobacteria bacterium]